MISIHVACLNRDHKQVPSVANLIKGSPITNFVPTVALTTNF